MMDNYEIWRTWKKSDISDEALADQLRIRVSELKKTVKNIETNFGYTIPEHINTNDVYTIYQRWKRCDSYDDIAKDFNITARDAHNIVREYNIAEMMANAFGVE